jgi:hypothetical protein
MTTTIRGFTTAALLSAILVLSGCNDSGGTTGSDDAAVATASVSGTMAVVTGGSQTLSITFASGDGQALSNLTVTSALSALPAGWSGPSTFSCAQVGTGSGCVLQLTYAPSTVESGALSLGFAYQDNAGAVKSGTVSVNYAATTHNHVAATAAASGQINATVGGGSQTVTLTFTTDDGNPATALTVTSDLAALPAGWSAPNSSFSCASVSHGNGCQLALTFARAQPRPER